MKKTKAMFFHLQPETTTSIDGKEVKQALTEDTKEHDLKYLGNWCEKARDINIRKALAWRSLHKMKKVWKSDLTKERKVQQFRATTETIQLYGCETWSLTKQDEKSLDGTFTPKLHMMYNIGLNKHVTTEALYGKISRK